MEARTITATSRVQVMRGSSVARKNGLRNGDKRRLLQLVAMGVPVAVALSILSRAEAVVFETSALKFPNVQLREKSGDATRVEVVDTATGLVKKNLELAMLDLTEVAPPAQPAVGSNILRLYPEDINGFTFLSYIDDTGMIRKVVRDSVFVARNNTGVDIPLGTPVYATGSTGTVPTVAPAMSNAIGKMPSIGLTTEIIENVHFGRVMQVGLLEHFDTHLLAVGSVLYVAPTGGLTVTPPTYPNIRQELGVVLVSGVGNGLIQCIARSMLYEPYIDHDGLLNLDHDSHPHYFLATGSRALAGNLVPDADGTRDLGDYTKGFKGIILHDQTDGKDYRLHVDSGVLHIVEEAA